MSKELPYFKFFSDQWLGKKITLESFETQGIFINVCAIYWANDCEINIATLQKRYGQAINYLVEEKYIKDKNGIAKISFLDSQWQERYKINKKLSNSGKAGALKRWGKNKVDNGVANGVAIENDIAIRKDKKREDNINEFDNEILFADLPNSSYIIEIAKNNKSTPDKIKSLIPIFRTKAELTYPSQKEFIKHFKNWVPDNLNLANEMNLDSLTKEDYLKERKRMRDEYDKKTDINNLVKS